MFKLVPIVYYWLCGISSKYERKDVAVLCFASTVMLIMEVLARKGAITKFLIRIHEWHGVTIMLGVLTDLVHEGVMKHPKALGAYYYLMFVISELLFIALYATEEISYKVSQVLTMLQSGYLLVHLITGDDSSAIACGITLLPCWIVKVRSYMNFVLFISF